MEDKNNNNIEFSDLLASALAVVVVGLVLEILGFVDEPDCESKEYLEKELKNAIDSENYEKCALIRDKIKALNK